jgi:DNA-binding MarR family transcriptional regulator
MSFVVSDRRLFFLIHRASRALVAHANAHTFEHIGVSSTQLAALYYVAKRPGCSMTDIADLLDLNKSAVSATAHRLEHAGLLRREPHPSDGRAGLLFLTAKGEAVRTKSLSMVRRLTADLTQGFTEEEMAAVFRFLNSVVERFGDKAKEDA